MTYAQGNGRFNVVAVSITTGAKRMIAEDKTEENAEAIIRMAVMRRGVDEEFFQIERAAPALDAGETP